MVLLPLVAAHGGCTDPGCRIRADEASTMLLPLDEKWTIRVIRTLAAEKIGLSASFESGEVASQCA